MIISGKVGISGASSGLGQYLSSKLSSLKVNLRETNQINPASTANMVAFVHCAYSYPPSKSTNSLLDHISEMEKITKKAIKISSGKFILISTLDVYPKNSSKIYEEDMQIDLRDIGSINGLVKLHLEKIVQENCENFAIIRCGLLVGEHARKGTIIRILENKRVETNLSADSTFSLVSHESILNLIQALVHYDGLGTFNWGDLESKVSIQKIAEIVNNRMVRFGEIQYLTPSVSKGRSLNLLGVEPPTSFEVISNFTSNNRIDRLTQ